MKDLFSVKGEYKFLSTTVLTFVFGAQKRLIEMVRLCTHNKMCWLGNKKNNF